MSINQVLIDRLQDSPRNTFIGGVKICLRLLNNIIDNPRDEKYRKFKRSNPKIANELLVVNGMDALFVHLGFEITENDEFVLRRGGIGVISKLKSYRDALKTRLELVENAPPVNQKKETKVQEKVVPIINFQIKADRPFHQRISFPSVLRCANGFLLQLEQLSDAVMQYEDETLQKSGLAIMPTEKFKLNAIENLRTYQKMIKEKKITEDEPPLDEFILEELAAWFKNEFFTWINNMSCKVCQQDTQPHGTHVDKGVRVEKYYCRSCNVVTDFPRYNDIEKLLVTRSGRCGEAANLFTFFCRCLKYDARYIYSTSDHVWTEVYYHTKKRFVHIDPSENVFDSPLMYEHGWKKKLDYIFAFSCDDVQDVTWRYSNKHEELKKRRRNCSEAELTSTIVALRNKRQANVSAARKKFLTLRTFAELSEMMKIRDPTKNELKGRSSGSLSWRLQREETSVSRKHVFEIKPEEESGKQFNLRYSCAKNKYERFIGGSVIETADDWKAWEYQSENIFRKVEHDHKMVYLSRTEDSEHGMIEWKFDFKKQSIKSIELKFDIKTFESGQIRLSFADASGKIVGSRDDLIGSSGFSIIANLSGGNGDCGWQHAQVFREKLDSKEYPFQVSVSFS